MAVPTSKIINLLNESISEGNGGKPADFDTWHAKARLAYQYAVKNDPDEMERFDGISYSLSMYMLDTPQQYFDDACADGVRQAIAFLEAALLRLDLEEADGPSVRIAGLHPWFAAAAASLWDAGQHRSAVETAGMNVEVQLKAKLGSTSGTFASAALQAFNTAPPTAKESRLRFTEFNSGTDKWTSAHEGAWYFGRGCAMRIRNLISHGYEPAEDEALECLAALSLYARWIEQAVVETP